MGVTGEHETAVAPSAGSGSGKQLAALADSLAGPEASGTGMRQGEPASDTASKTLLATELGARKS